MNQKSAFTIAGRSFGFEEDDLEAWAEHIDELALDSELGELLHEAFDLIGEGLASFPGGRVTLIESVYFHHHDIAKLVVSRGASIPYAIRFYVSETDSLTNSELICAYAIAKAAKGLKQLADWIHAIEVDLLDEGEPELVSGSRARLLDAKTHEPEIYGQIVDDHRKQWPSREIEARETCVRYLGEARHALMFSSLYDKLGQTQQVIESQQIEARMRRQAQAEAGKKGRPHQEWARSFLEVNLERLAYDQYGRKLSKNRLTKLLLEKVLPEERERQLRRPNPKGEPTTPSQKTLYGEGDKGRPGWLVEMGFNNLPDLRST
ncbi:hypothetical protein [Billgrantia desiderata]|uniref:hypothetical protein n=1 Tax=Billgrantia desiderata TaxID=52021 RepID=UPI003F2F0BA0